MSAATDVREFFQRCPARIIGITGTRGKTKTADLIARMLEEAGKRVWVGGDAARPPLNFLPKVKASDLVVLELSSVQLMDLDASPHIAVCLMISPEDANEHRNAREYIAAKGNLFWHQQPGDVAIYDAVNDFSTQIAQLSQGRKVPFMRAPGARLADGWVKVAGVKICDVPVEIVSSDNFEIICAAVTIAWEVLGDRPEPIRRAIAGFNMSTPRGKG